MTFTDTFLLNLSQIDLPRMPAIKTMQCSSRENQLRLASYLNSSAHACHWQTIDEIFITIQLDVEQRITHNIWYYCKV